MSALFNSTLLIIFKNTLSFLQNPHFISVLRLQFFEFFWIKNRACFFGSISINFSFALKMTFFIAYFLRNGLFSAFLGIFLDFSFFCFFVILNDKLQFNCPVFGHASPFRLFRQIPSFSFVWHPASLYAARRQYNPAGIYLSCLPPRMDSSSMRSPSSDQSTATASILL